jgi:uncharacterized protein YjbI with pentapeptide repeats
MAKIAAEEFLARYQAGERDFRGIDLSGVDLSGSEWRDINLSGADLGGANLTGVKWSHINFSGADLRDANLTGSLITSGGMYGASFNANGAEFIDCYMMGAWIEGSLENTTISRCDLLGASFNHTVIQNVKFIDNRMSGCFFEARIENVEFIECDLSGSFITDSTFRSIRLEKSDLRGVTFYQTPIQLCQFIKSDLRGVVYCDYLLTKDRLSNIGIGQTSFQDITLSDGETVVSYP